MVADSLIPRTSIKKCCNFHPTADLNFSVFVCQKILGGGWVILGLIWNSFLHSPAWSHKVFIVQYIVPPVKLLQTRVIWYVSYTIHNDNLNFAINCWIHRLTDDGRLCGFSALLNWTRTNTSPSTSRTSILKVSTGGAVDWGCPAQS